MKEKQLIFRMAARCEAAGRPNNEDNFLIDDNLSDNQWGFTADTEINLEDKGALLVVCDGMGGMNAGEIASAIAVSTIKEWFAADRLTEKVLESATSIQGYIVDAIQVADAAIKKDGKENPEHEGMGSTIVLAWLLGEKVYVGWCGDSRAYRYNSKTGLVRLSHDHSYVQELVDAGKLTEELAFDHPNNNIITRSLGDPRGKAQPDTQVYDLCNEDIILLCSDGLCGCLRDNEIAEIIGSNQTSMQGLRDALWEADEAAGWHDNVTVALAQVISGGAVVTSAPSAVQPQLSDSKAELLREKRKWKIIAGCLFVVLLAGLAILICPKYFHSEEEKVVSDTIAIPKQSGDTVLSNSAVTSSATAQPAPSKKSAPAKAEEPSKAETPSNGKIELNKLEQDDLNHTDGHVEGVERVPSESDAHPEVQGGETPAKVAETPSEEESARPATPAEAPKEPTEGPEKLNEKTEVVEQTETSVTVKIEG